MPQPGGRIFDDFSRLMTDASGLASGVRREVETLVRGQVERLLSAMDVVSRDEFEAVKSMAALARDENERLERRILDLERKLGAAPTPPPGSGVDRYLNDAAEVSGLLLLSQGKVAQSVGRKVARRWNAKSIGERVFSDPSSTIWAPSPRRGEGTPPVNVVS